MKILFSFFLLFILIVNCHEQEDTITNFENNVIKAELMLEEITLHKVSGILKIRNKSQEEIVFNLKDFVFMNNSKHVNFLRNETKKPITFLYEKDKIVSLEEDVKNIDLKKFIEKSKILQPSNYVVRLDRYEQESFHLEFFIEESVKEPKLEFYFEGNCVTLL